MPVLQPAPEERSVPEEKRRGAGATARGTGRLSYPRSAKPAQVRQGTAPSALWDQPEPAADCFQLPGEQTVAEVWGAHARAAAAAAAPRGLRAAAQRPALPEAPLPTHAATAQRCLCLRRRRA